MFIIVLSLTVLSTTTTISYKILNPKGVDAEKEPKKIAAAILDVSGLDPELYRLGNTKAWSLLQYMFSRWFFVCSIDKRISCHLLEVAMTNTESKSF